MGECGSDSFIRVTVELTKEEKDLLKHSKEKGKQDDMYGGRFHARRGFRKGLRVY